GWQTQSVHLLPRPDAHLGWIQIRALFFQVDAPALGALLFFQGATRAVIVAQITGVAVRASIVRKRRRRWGHWFFSLARPEAVATDIIPIHGRLVEIIFQCWRTR